jgi:hypothetical protein
MASAVMALAIAVPVRAQGKSTGKGHKSSPPSSTPLPNPATGPATGASPLAWLDDASLLAPGSMTMSLSAMRWSGADLSEMNAPIVDVSVGLAPRFQIGANVPHVVGSSDGSGVVGGIGTSYISSKIALLTGGSGVKVAVSPMVEILGEGAVQGLASDHGRAQFGLPLSMEIARGPARVFGSAGFFTRGARFAGGGAGLQATPKVGVSLSFTRSWVDGSGTEAPRDRRELGGGVSYFVRPQIGVYGALGQTIATTDDNGAGTTVSGGVTFFLNARVTK